MMSWLAGSYLSWLTPMTMVTSSSLAGAEMITFLAPLLRCWAASSRLVKMPVDSMTTSARGRPRGWDGSRWALASTRSPPTVIDSSSKDTSSPSRPKVESYLSR